MTGVLRVLVMGYEAPPVNGMTVATEVLASIAVPDVRVESVLVPSRSRLQGTGRAGMENVVRALRFMARFLCARPWAYDVVHVPISQAPFAMVRDLLVVAICILARTPFVIHLHGGEYRATVQTFPRPILSAIKFLMSRTSGAIVLSPMLREQLSWLGDDVPVFVCRNGLPDSPPAASVGVRDGEEFRVGFIGAICRRKGVDVLLRATTDMPGVSVILAGELYEELRMAVDRHSSVAYLGRVNGDEKAAFFSFIDVLVLPSRFQEGQPMSLIEAMRAATPVVVTDRPHLREMLGSPASFVPEGDAARLREALEELRPYGERNQRGASLRKRYLELYTDLASQRNVIQVWREAASVATRPDT